MTATLNEVADKVADKVAGKAAGEPSLQRRPPPPLPLTVLTGFLGAGKTTLLNRLLADPALADTAVLINEFGEVGLDHLLVEQVAEGVVLLSSGCLCCTVRGDLVDALERLTRDLDNGRAAFSRVAIETTGLADPAPVLHTIMAHPYLVMRYRLDGVVTLIDAVNGMATLDAHPEAVKQAAVADRLIVTKTDLAGGVPPALAARLAALNPAAPLLDAAAGEATPARLLDCGLYDPQTKSADVRRWLAAEAYEEGGGRGHHHGHDHHHDHHRDHDHGPHHHGHHHGVGVTGEAAHDRNRHDDHIRAFAIASDEAIPAGTFDLFLELLRSLHGPNLLRVKGIVKLAEQPGTPLVIHGVQHVFHPPAALPGWPDADHRTRLVFIVRDIEERAVRELFAAFMNTPAPDRPDRAALADNPLVPFGGRDR